MSGECEKCGEHTLDCQCNKTHTNIENITKKTYEKYGISFSLYEENNHFYGTPIPEGYKAIYIDNGIFPPSLQLQKIEMKNEGKKNI